MHPLEIIPFDFENYDHLHALVELMEEYMADKMGGAEPYTDLQKKQLVKGLKEHPSKILLLARIDEEYVGLINCFVNFSTFAARPFVNIHDVIVSSQWRNRQIGRKLIEKVLEEAAGMNCSKVTLEVREDNSNAKHLYASMGFHDSEPRQYYWTKYMQ